MNKNLLILIDYAELSFADPSILKKCNRLALTPAAALAFEESMLPYQTLNELYDVKNFQQDNLEMMREAEGLLGVLDKKYEPLLNVPRSFTGSIYWFLVFFADIRYINKICNEIREDYTKVYLMGSCAYEESLEIDLNSCDANTLAASSVGIKRKVDMLKRRLNPECIWLPNSEGPLHSINMNRYQLGYLFRKLLKKAISQLLRLFSWDGNDRKKTFIFAIQGEYEVRLLRSYMRDFCFTDPIRVLLEASERGQAGKMRPLFAKELEGFVARWFPEFRQVVFDFVTVYHDKMLSHLKKFSEDFVKMLDDYNPAALFYATCSHIIYEDVCAYFANEKDIPVFYFQHGGATILCNNPYQKYLEQNNNIKKINILHAKREEELLKKDLSMDCYGSGSINLYRFYNSHRRVIFNSQRKVLYCSALLNLYSYKDIIMVNLPDKHILEMSKDVVNIIHKFHLKMDIKVHPGDESYNYLYFKSLLKRRHSKNIRILRGFPVERVIRKYGLMILDQITSMLIPISIVLNIPVILYLKEMPDVSEEVMGDMKKRFYIVRDRSELERYLNLYTEDRLEPKFSLDMVDKYAFPIECGDPGFAISKYVQERIKNR